MRKNPDIKINSEKWTNDFMGHWGNLLDVANRTQVSDLEDKSDRSSLFLRTDRYFARSIASDLVGIKPMSAPTGTLFYMDTVLTYTDEEQIEMNPLKWMRENVKWIEIRTKQIKQ